MNKKNSVISFLLFYLSITLSAQKEVYFADKVRDSVSISSLRGVSISLSTGNIETMYNFNIQYFNELKMSSASSLILGAGVINSKYIKSVYTYQDNSTLPVFEYDYGYGIQFNIFAEPRWYFTYQNRYMKGAKTALNSGWFLGLPVELNSSVLNSKKKFSVNLLVSPTVGYRYALTNKFYIEAQTGLGFNNLLGDYYRFGISGYLKVKAAYTF